MRAAALTLLALVVGAGAAAAGSSASPEIEDPASDITVSGGGFVNVPVPELDLRAVWWTVEDGTVRVSFRVQDLSQRTLVDESLRYFLMGSNEEYALVGVSAAYSPSAHPEWRWMFSYGGCNQGPCDGGLAQGVVDEAADTIHVAFPASFLASDVECPVASTIVGARSGWSSYSGGGPVWFRDHAPNDLSTCAPPIAVT